MRVVTALALIAGCGDRGGAPQDAPSDVLGLEAGPGMLSVVPMTIDLGFTPGNTGLTVRVTNTWVVPTAPLSLSLTGPGAAFYRLMNDSCGGASLAANSTCTVDVFTTCLEPEVRHDAALEIRATPGGSATVPITGKVLGKSCGALLFVTGSPAAFGAQVVGTTSALHRFTFSNGGGQPSAPLVPMLEGTDPGEFTLAASTCNSVSLPAGGACTVDIAFAPTSPGAKAADLRVAPTTVGSVSGTGVAAAAAPP